MIFRGVIISFLCVPLLIAQDLPVKNLGAESVIGVDGLVYSVLESFAGEDLNGDGDLDDEVLEVYHASTGETENLGLVGTSDHLTRAWLRLEISEIEQGEDLNDDGDARDDVIHVYNPSTRETRNLGLVHSWFRIVSAEWLVLGVSESGQSEDLNGDGDTRDPVAHLHDLLTGETENLGLAGGPLLVAEDWLVLGISESQQGMDLNGDGDTDDQVVHVHDVLAGETTNLGLALSGTGRTFLRVSGFVQDVLVLGSVHTGAGDPVVQIRNLSTGEARTLRLGLYDFSVHGEWLIMEVTESLQGDARTALSTITARISFSYISVNSVTA